MTHFVILTSPGCSYCEKAKRRLDQLAHSYTEIDITKSAGIRAFMDALDLRTVPQVFDRHVRLGGYTELIHQFGEPFGQPEQ